MPVNVPLTLSAAGSSVVLPLRGAPRRRAFEPQFRALACSLGACGPRASAREVISRFNNNKTVRLVWIGTPRSRPIGSRPPNRCVCVIKNNETILDVFIRSRAYMPLHTLLAAAGRQEIDRARLKLALQFMRAVGPEYSGIFNRAGLTRDRFHAQVFIAITPLRIAIQSRRSQNRWKRIGAGVEASVLEDWPMSAIAFRGRTPGAVADKVAVAATALRRMRLTYDLTFHYADGKLWVVVFARRASSDDEWGTYSPERKQLGKFGALELSGVIVSVRSKPVFRAFAENPTELGRRYRRALLDMSVADVLDRLMGMVAARRD